MGLGAVNPTVTGQVTSLSPFGLGEPVGPAGPATGGNTYMVLVMGLISLASGVIVLKRKIGLQA